MRVKPEAGLAWMTLGLVENNRGDLEGATAALAQAVYLEPKNARAHNYFAATLSRRGWYSGGGGRVARAVELEPNFAEAHFNLALTYLLRDPPSVELARRHYQKALELGAAPDAGIERQAGEGAGERCACRESRGEILEIKNTITNRIKNQHAGSLFS